MSATAEVEIGGCFESEFAFFQLPVGGDHGDVVWEKNGGDGHRGIEQTAWVVAKVKHQPFHFRVLLVKLFEFAGQVIDRAFLELADAYPTKAVFDHLALDADGLDFFADDGDGEGAVFVLAEHGQNNLGAGFTAHALDRFVERHAFDHGIVDFRDQVSRLEAGAVGG